MLDKTLEQIAQKINMLDEASLTRLLPRYKLKMEEFEPTRMEQASSSFCDQRRRGEHIFNESSKAKKRRARRKNQSAEDDQV